MGNNCTGAREQAAEKWQNTKNAVGSSVDATGNAIGNAGAYTKDSFECGKMRM
jgi:hypothetical protein